MSLSLSPIRGPSIVVLGGDAPLIEVAEKAMHLAFRGARLEKVSTLLDATKLDADPANTLLLVLTATEGDLAAACAAVDEFELPRWGVIALTENAETSPALAVSRQDWEVRILLRLFQAALELHGVRRENACFRGDLTAIATRVTHDLRSPLGGVLTTVDVLQEVLGEEAPSRLSLLQPIQESTDGLTKLIRQLSVLTKASGSGYVPQRFNMNEPFWAALQRVEREVAARGATLVQPASWPEVQGDAAWLEVMWHAFLSNSLQHGGPKLRIEAGWRYPEKGEFRFWLVDSGRMSPGKRAMLFRPFHLLHQPNAPRGFGLPIVRRLVELQGGKAGYEATPEGDSCFFFTLPA